MADFLTQAQVRNYDLYNGNTVDLIGLIGTGDPRKLVLIDDPTKVTVGTVAYVAALGHLRRGVVTKTTKAKIYVAFTTQGAVDAARQFEARAGVSNQGIRVQTTIAATVYIAPRESGKLEKAQEALAETLDRVLDEAEKADQAKGGLVENVTGVRLGEDGSVTPSETDPAARILDQPNPAVGDTVEWVHIPNVQGYVTHVTERRIAVLWTDRKTGLTGTDVPLVSDFHKDWRITTLPDPAPGIIAAVVGDEVSVRPGAEARVQAILNLTGPAAEVAAIPDQGRGVKEWARRKIEDARDLVKITPEAEIPGLGRSLPVNPQPGLDHEPLPLPATYSLTFDRIGRNHQVPRVDFHVPGDQAYRAGQFLAERVHTYAGSYLTSRDFTVELSLETGRVEIGGGRFGEGRVERIAVSPNE